MKERLGKILAEAGRESWRVVVMTGAGISQESGIPTFRGKDGFWTVGSKVYQPQEIATWEMFSSNQEWVWPWYLYRRAMCLRALPNAAHEALVALERALGERFQLVTQNIDGLHLRAGHAEERVYQIHGSFAQVRCSECSRAPFAFPPTLDRWERDQPLDEETRAQLHCGSCRGWLRPHVLWFDEYYDEENYFFESAQEAVSRAQLLVVVGTSGATTLPARLGAIAAQTGTALIDVNPDDNPFAELARQVDRGGWIQGPATERVPALVDAILKGREGRP